MKSRKIPPALQQRGISIMAGLLLLAFGAFSGCSLVGSSGNTKVDAQQTQANALYEEAWNVIDQEYVDSTFNGQDWGQWRYRFQGKLKDPQDAYVAIGTMVASLNDEYTRFLRPRDMSEQTMSIDSKLYGVGIQISMRDNKLMVLATLDGTPADKAGLMPKDIITAIDGHETAGMSVEDAADRIRGERGTYVTLSLKRDNHQLLKKRIQRDEIKLKSVFTRPLDDPKIGYIRLSSFISETMLGEMDDAMRKEKGKKALIIDLRGNYGGLFTNAVEIADMFLDSGDIVSIVNRDKDRRVYPSRPGAIFRKPVVVLIDGGSASASEILSGALKDNKRATLIGSQSFGKGLVQKINMLANGAGMNITISKYLTPNGTDINKKGIEPDIKVPFTEKDFLSHRDPQLARAEQFLKAELASGK